MVVDGAALWRRAVVPDGEEKATAGAEAAEAVPQGGEQRVVRQEVREGVVGGEDHTAEPVRYGKVLKSATQAGKGTPRCIASSRALRMAIRDRSEAISR